MSFSSAASVVISFAFRPFNLTDALMMMMMMNRLTLSTNKSHVSGLFALVS
jgi:hypothetical protein